jgi:hypothetical protein
MAASFVRTPSDVIARAESEAASKHVYRAYLSMALQPLVGPWPLFQFLDHLHIR